MHGYSFPCVESRCLSATWKVLLNQSSWSVLYNNDCLLRCAKRSPPRVVPASNFPAKK
jgi:hypothetical protein